MSFLNRDFNSKAVVRQKSTPATRGWLPTTADRRNPSRHFTYLSRFEGQSYGTARDYETVAYRRPNDSRLFVSYRRRIWGKSRCIDGDAALSYHDLNARSNQLAHYLRGLGIGEDRVVAIRLPRGMAMLIAIFAIVKLVVPIYRWRTMHRVAALKIY